MKKNAEEKIKLMQNFIKMGDLEKVKDLVSQEVDIHYSNDYFLYLASFFKHVELQHYFIDIGLDPEEAKGRLAVAHPKMLDYLRNYKIEKMAREFSEALDQSLTNKNEDGFKLKI
jgi:hypothetical protein